MPAANASEAAVVNDIEVFGVENIGQAVSVLKGEACVSPTVVDTRGEFMKRAERFDFDFSDVRGQEAVKRAFEVAATIFFLWGLRAPARA